MFKLNLLASNKKLNDSSNDRLVFLGLSLFPDDQLCPKRKSFGCGNNCLVFSGNGRFTNVNRKRLERAKLLKENKDLFMALLRADLNLLSTLVGYTFYIRLNVFSDLDWSHLIKEYSNVSNLNFYDYSKVYSRESLPNYKVIYSGHRSLLQSVNGLKKLDQLLDKGSVYFVTREKMLTSLVKRYPLLKLYLDNLMTNPTELTVVSEKNKIFIAKYKLATGKGSSNDTSNNMIVL